MRTKMATKIDHPTLHITQDEYDGREYFNCDIRKMKAEHPVEFEFVYDEPLTGETSKFQDRKGNNATYSKFAFKLVGTDDIEEVQVFMFDSVRGRLANTSGKPVSLSGILKDFESGDRIKLKKTEEFIGYKGKGVRVFVVEPSSGTKPKPASSAIPIKTPNKQTDDSEPEKTNTVENGATDLEKQLASQLEEAGLTTVEDVTPTCESAEAKKANGGKPVDPERIVKIMNGQLR